MKAKAIACAIGTRARPQKNRKAMPEPRIPRADATALSPGPASAACDANKAPDISVPARLRQNKVVKVPSASTSPFITASIIEKVAMPAMPTKKAVSGGCSRPSMTAL